VNGGQGDLRPPRQRRPAHAELLAAYVEFSQVSHERPEKVIMRDYLLSLNHIISDEFFK
jgi:hypothetical protein